ncbi:histidinol dehydrogenase [Terrilactibacillus sp. BCM23-1]|uniref:Histidinol dehydrogenase n=1 Tax=Terrilactibacillus tamarindi TaxID=2599694 RepID=A0A6N8CNE0_9BACI|nr:histidinol dehydrogenase [Terrilactibacillus tamarindi]MTT31644.1 histidinol dehydrogenase [Terrilactibacillus tamarindi]
MEWIKNGDLSYLEARKIGVDEAKQNTVKEIINEVKQRGDQALYDYTERFDGVKLTHLKVTKEQINEAYSRVSDDVVNVIKKAASNIRTFFEKQKPESWSYTNDEGTVLGQQITPLDAAGVYVPGGTAAYPSSVLMGAIPALVAGVKRIVLVSPPQKTGMVSDGVLVAANEIGIDEIYQVGGAHAIAALAYGTETIKPVDKIVGPGNIFVTLAKKEVFGDVAIDSLAGPSEIVILADETANSEWIASDLLSQAEHDPLAMAALITPSKEFGQAVEEALEKQLSDLPRQNIARQSIEQFGKIILVKDNDEGIDVINQMAPEHLEVVIKDAEEKVKQIKHAGAIFLGPYSPVPIGDYFAGPNHIIPTNGSATYSSPLSVESFVKQSSIIKYSREAILNNSQHIATFARYEGFEGHARAVENRLKEETD